MILNKANNGNLIREMMASGDKEILKVVPNHKNIYHDKSFFQEKSSRECTTQNNLLISMIVISDFHRKLLLLKGHRYN